MKKRHGESAINTYTVIVENTNKQNASEVKIATFTIALNAFKCKKHAVIQSCVKRVITLIIREIFGSVHNTL